MGAEIGKTEAALALDVRQHLSQAAGAGRQRLFLNVHGVPAHVYDVDGRHLRSRVDAEHHRERREPCKHVLDGVSQGLPALLRAYKLQSKAAKVGFDWQDSASVWAKVQEELGELQEALQAGDKAAAESELGDVLFAVVNYARHNGIEPEVALDGTNNRFASRFNYVEEQVEGSGKTWQDFTLNELDEFWNQAKELERKSDL